MLCRYGFPFTGPSRALLLAGVAALLVLPASLPATTLDFGEALQDYDAGQKVGTVQVGNSWMKVSCRNNGDGPDQCIIFDSSDPTGGDDDLGTPNEDFDGPGEGSGGERGEAGENRESLGNILIIPENGLDEDNDGLVDVPDDESSGGLIKLRFSHAGRLSLTLVDVDRDEDEPRLFLYKEGELVDIVHAENLGDNSVQHLDLASKGDIDRVDIRLDGSTGIGDIVLDVMTVGVEPSTWSAVKGIYR